MPRRVPLGLSVALPPVVVVMAPTVPVPVYVGGFLSARPVVVLAIVAPLLVAVFLPLATAVVGSPLPEALLAAEVPALGVVGVGAQPALARRLRSPRHLWGRVEGVRSWWVAGQGEGGLLILPPERGRLPRGAFHLQREEEKGRGVQCTPFPARCWIPSGAQRNANSRAGPKSHANHSVSTQENESFWFGNETKHELTE